MDKQVVILLPGSESKMKDRFVKMLKEHYGCVDCIHVTKVLRELLADTFHIDKALFEGKKMAKPFDKPLVVTPKHLSALVRNVKATLPREHKFNPHTVTKKSAGLSFFISPKHMLLEVGSKFLTNCVPDFCALTSYALLNGRKGLFIIDGIRRTVEVVTARSCFSNLYVVGIPYSLPTEIASYSIEQEASKINCDFKIDSEKDFEAQVKQLMDTITKEAVDEMIVKVSKSQSGLVQQVGKATFEHKSLLRNRNVVNWPQD